MMPKKVLVWSLFLLQSTQVVGDEKHALENEEKDRRLNGFFRSFFHVTTPTAAPYAGSNTFPPSQERPWPLLWNGFLGPPPTAATPAPSISSKPTISRKPTGTPTKSPTLPPTRSPTPVPSRSPSLSQSPTGTAPTTASPTRSPTGSPSLRPSLRPSVTPSLRPSVPTKSFAQTVIESKALGGASDFSDPESYQSKALERTLQQDNIDSMTEGKIIQYYALYCIYNATSKVPNLITDNDSRFDTVTTFPGWSTNTGWDKNNVDPCDFFGITCDRPNLVTRVELPNNQLTGNFPPEIKLLASDGDYSTGAGNLFLLDVKQNEFLYNNKDSSWVADLGSDFASIDLSITSFAGQLPKFPSEIIDIAISFTLFEGGLNTGIFDGLDTLEYLELDGNSFGEGLPNSLAQLSSLANVFVSDSNIVGSLQFMVGMPQIREFWIDKNPNLSNAIPVQIGESTTLESLSLTENGLTGAIPSQLGLLTQLSFLWLYGNKLTGQVPSELANLGKAKLIRMEENNLSGDMPAELCTLLANFLSPLDLLGSDASVCGSSTATCECCSCCNIASCDALG